jgi:hypothetical protein
MATARKTNQYGENDDRFRFSNEDQDHRFSWQDCRWNDDDHGHHPHHGHGRGHDHSDGRGHDRHHDDHRLDWQNARFDRHDDRLRVDEDDYTTFGSLDPSSTEDGTYLWVGTGNSATNFNTFVNHEENLELGLKIKYRGGEDILPTTTENDGSENYEVPAGLAEGSDWAAKWSFDFSVNTGINGSDETLDEFDFRIVVTSGDEGERAVFNLDHVSPGVTPWVHRDGGGFADEDGYGTGQVLGGSPQISQNSVNLGFNFMQEIFGDDYADAGEQYNIQLQAFDGHKLVGIVENTVDIV